MPKTQNLKAIALLSGTIAAILFVVWITGARGSSAQVILSSVGIMVVMFAGNIYFSADRPENWSLPSSWKTKRGLATIWGSATLALSIILSVIPFFNPGGSTEPIPGGTYLNAKAAAENTAKILENSVNASGSTAPVRKEISGIWCEPDSAVSYHFTLEGDQLTTTWSVPPPGASDYRDTSQVASAKGHELISFSPKNGAAATLTVSKVGNSETLKWWAHDSNRVLLLTKCNSIVQ